MFGFDPMAGAINVVNFMPYLVLIAGLFAVVILFFNGRPGTSLGAFVISIMLFYILFSGSLIDVGKGISDLLTITSPSNQTTTVIPSNSGKTTPVIPDNTGGTTPSNTTQPAPQPQ